MMMMMKEWTKIECLFVSAEIFFIIGFVNLMKLYKMATTFSFFRILEI